MLKTSKFACEYVLEENVMVCNFVSNTSLGYIFNVYVLLYYNYLCIFVHINLIYLSYTLLWSCNSCWYAGEVSVHGDSYLTSCM